ncbi:MAG: hypothetical protein HYU73_17640 [Betaproteobacteria bacterium]|nr:hypothetical protein [Betaproteobacteria bacterium]
MSSIKRNTVMTMGAAALLAMGIAQADDSAALRTESNRLELNAALSGQTQAGTRIIHDYTGFAGSRANASNLVIGLRRGTPITLTPAPGNGQDAAPISFTPPVRALGNSAVYISLALAKQQLANFGISQPTPLQIKAAIIGGTVSSGGAVTRTAALPGVLTLRGQGMSWAGIAKSQGVRLGAVVDGMQGASHDLIALRLHYAAVETARQMPAAR